MDMSQNMDGINFQFQTDLLLNSLKEYNGNTTNDLSYSISFEFLYVNYDKLLLLLKDIKKYE